MNDYHMHFSLQGQTFDADLSRTVDPTKRAVNLNGVAYSITVHSGDAEQLFQLFEPQEAPSSPIAEGRQVTSQSPGMPKMALAARVHGVASTVISETHQILQEAMTKLGSALQNLIPFDPKEPLNAAPVSIQNRMNQLCVPGVGLAVIHRGVVVSLGFGQLENTKLLTQAASISKTLTALTVLSLVGEGEFSLDDDVGTILGDDLWADIDDQKLTDGDKPKVTILHLLSHTAGINIGGYSGYTKEDVQSEDFPSTTDKLLKAVKLVHAPDEARFEYSGGGFEVLRKIVELKDRPFAEAVKGRVLGKLGMPQSTYSLDEGVATANGNDPQGVPLPGGWFTYPQLAAAGLWTTPAELAMVVKAIQQAYESDGGIISKVLAEEMLTARTVGKPNGLGVFVEKLKNSVVFFHPGENAGFRNVMVGNNKGQGIVVMTNSDYGGKELWKETVAAIAKEFNWPDHERLPMCQPLFKPSEVFKKNELDSFDLREWSAEYVGSYSYEENGKKHTAMITEEGGKIFVQEDDYPRMEVTPLGPNLGCFRQFIPGPYDMLRFKKEPNSGRLTLDLFGKVWQGEYHR